MTKEEEEYELYGKCIKCCAFVVPGRSPYTCDNCWNGQYGLYYELTFPIPWGELFGYDD